MFFWSNGIAVSGKQESLNIKIESGGCMEKHARTSVAKITSLSGIPERRTDRTIDTIPIPAPRI
jgi:hypothetical protein